MKDDFFKYQAQTTPHPLGIEISHAHGSYIYDTSNKAYLDFIAGVSANSLGHNNSKIYDAITQQLKQYSHVMVYGEFIQQPPSELCKVLAKTLPEYLSSVYLVNSGTEATEGALKLARKYTNRTEIIAAKNAYHGNTAGSMSVCGAEQQNRAFRPLAPGVRFIQFNAEKELEKITSQTAAVLLETIQGGAGFIEPVNNFLDKVKEKCEKTGALLILDEIQTGIGRTGKFWGFENYHVIPDIIITGKGLGGGMPIGAFISSRKIMSSLKENPKLGHITTFGGHPVIAASGLATVNEVINTTLIRQTLEKEKIIRSHLNHPLIKEIRGRGLMLALIMESPETANQVILNALDKGLILFWLLYDKKAIRMTPPLTISDKEVVKGCEILTKVLDNL